MGLSQACEVSKMKKEILYLAGGFVAGLLIALAVYAFAPERSMNNDMTMNEMSTSLAGKSGDEFDMAFIDLMTEHHQGAIAMANLAKTNAGHDEIRNMADDIISAQASEVEMMKGWKAAWFGDAG
jgi:uncharacterized protein (DUF305 family)